jgi:molecular chaperone HtpG
MSSIGGGMMAFGNLPDHYNLVINTNHPLMSKVLAESDKEKQDNVIRQLNDLALLSQNLLKGEKLTEFVKRSINLI